MGLFDALTSLASATVKTALTPVAIVKDAANIITGEEANSTKDLLKSAVNDAADAVDEIVDPQ